MQHLVNPNQHRKKNYNTESCDPRPRNAVRTVCGTRRNISNGYNKKLRLVIFPFCQYLQLFNVNMCPSLRCIKYLCTVHTIYNAIVYSAGPVIMQFFLNSAYPPIKHHVYTHAAYCAVPPHETPAIRRLPQNSQRHGASALRISLGEKNHSVMEDEMQSE